METIEYKTVDKSTWGQGPWQEEPDKKQWLDEATGYPCLIVRNFVGALCGYVGVNAQHPLFEKEYGEVTEEIDVHGGLTFSEHCSPESDEAKGICHKVDNEDKVWWFGFDCAHAFDIAPRMHSDLVRAGITPFHHELLPPLVYRDWQYVTEQIQSLAQQLKAVENS